MRQIRLRPVRAADLPSLVPDHRDVGEFEDFGFTAANEAERTFAATGMISDDYGTLIVEDADGSVAGIVGWSAVQHGPTSTARALNVGISLFASHRGKGIGSAAQARFAEYLFTNTLVERLEAGTDVENIAEQRALERAGFQREGIARHAQFRAGGWHDLVMYSRLRGDVASPSD